MGPDRCVNVTRVSWVRAVMPASVYWASLLHAMSHLVRSAAVVTLALLAGVGYASPAAADERGIVIRVYDAAGNAPDVRAAAIRTAAAVIQDAGLVIDWRDCSREGSRGFCHNAPGMRNLVVRIMPSVTPGHAAAAGLAADGEKSMLDLELGFAVVDAGTLSGAMATIFNERVRAVSQRVRIDFSALLGRAIAHEIGHLLLRTAGHSSSGLMRAVWTDAELTLDRREDWLFAAPERRHLQALVVQPSDDGRALAEGSTTESDRPARGDRQLDARTP